MFPTGLTRLVNQAYIHTEIAPPPVTVSGASASSRQTDRQMEGRKEYGTVAITEAGDRGTLAIMGLRLRSSLDQILA